MDIYQRPLDLLQRVVSTERESVCVWTDTFVHCKCTISYDSSGIAHIIHSPKPSYVCILRKIPPAGLETAHGLDRRRQAAICSVF